MCGIVYLESFDGTPVNNGILDQFDAQRHRGVEGFGLFDGQELNIVRTTTEDKMLKWLVKYDSNLLLFHHRFPTSTKNTKRTAHPFATKKYFGKRQYILVHNGHITNSRSLRQQHSDLGISYQSEQKDGSFNDSEALLWDFALFMEGKQKRIEAYGQMAFVCVMLEGRKLKKMYFGRNSNPLKMFRTKKGIALSSEGPGDSIEADKLYTWNYELKRLTKRDVEFPFYSPIDSNYSYAPSGNVIGSDTGWRDWDTARQRYLQRYEDYHESYEIPPENDEAWEEEVVSEVSRQLYGPTMSEIQSCSLGFLFRAKGVFADAVTAVEDELYQMVNDVETEEEIRRQLLLEDVLWWLEEDPEYKSGESVSSWWKPFGQQLELTEA